MGGVRRQHQLPFVLESDICGAVSTLLAQHWILPGPLSGMTHFRMQDGPITCVRFDGEHGRYALAVGEGVDL